MVTLKEAVEWAQGQRDIYAKRDSTYEPGRTYMMEIYSLLVEAASTQLPKTKMIDVWYVQSVDASHDDVLWASGPYKNLGGATHEANRQRLQPRIYTLVAVMGPYPFEVPA